MMVSFTFDLNVPAERQEVERLWALQTQPSSGVDEEKVKQICATRAGQLVLVGAARHFAPGEIFTRHSLAEATGHRENQVFSWICQLGRPQKRLGIRVFDSHTQPDGGTAYSLSPEMHATVLRVA
jgi:hypothetical protein